VSDEEPERAVLIAERALQAAMLAGDVQALDRLLHPELLGVGPDGQMIDKSGDLAAHRAGLVVIDELHEEAAHVTVLDNVAVTFVVLRMRGSIDGSEVSGCMRYTRTWICDDGTWRVMAAHISAVAE